MIGLAERVLWLGIVLALLRTKLLSPIEGIGGSCAGGGRCGAVEPNQFLYGGWRTTGHQDNPSITAAIIAIGADSQAEVTLALRSITLHHREGRRIDVFLIVGAALLENADLFELLAWSGVGVPFELPEKPKSSSGIADVAVDQDLEKIPAAFCVFEPQTTNAAKTDLCQKRPLAISLTSRCHQSENACRACKTANKHVKTKWCAAPAEEKSAEEDSATPPISPPPQSPCWTTGVRIHVLPVANELLARTDKFQTETGFQTTHYSGTYAMAKIFLPRFVPRDRFLLLDADMLVLRDLGELWDHGTSVQPTSPWDQLDGEELALGGTEGYAIGSTCPPDRKRVKLSCTGRKAPDLCLSSRAVRQWPME